MNTTPLTSSPTQTGGADAPNVSRAMVLSLSLSCAGLFGAMPPTSANPHVPPGVLHAQAVISNTSTGDSRRSIEGVDDGRADPQGGMAELRQRIGLTWDKLGELFAVSRRAAHYWASGQPMSEAHEAHLQDCLAVLRRTDRGDALTNRRALFMPDDSGTSAFAHLVQHRYAEALSTLGAAADRASRLRGPVVVPADRLPPPVEQFVEVGEVPVHVSEAGPRRQAKVVRRSRSG